VFCICSEWFAAKRLLDWVLRDGVRGDGAGDTLELHCFEDTN
jgi:hypothetical protein